jgi:hypothetical protein
MDGAQAAVHISPQWQIKSQYQTDNRNEYVQHFSVSSHKSLTSFLDGDTFWTTPCSLSLLGNAMVFSPASYLRSRRIDVFGRTIINFERSAVAPKD